MPPLGGTPGRRTPAGASGGGGGRGGRACAHAPPPGTCQPAPAAGTGQMPPADFAPPVPRFSVPFITIKYLYNSTVFEIGGKRRCRTTCRRAEARASPSGCRRALVSHTAPKHHLRSPDGRRRTLWRAQRAWRARPSQRSGGLYNGCRHGLHRIPHDNGHWTEPQGGRSRRGQKNARCVERCAQDMGRRIEERDRRIKERPDRMSAAIGTLAGKARHFQAHA